MEILKLAYLNGYEAKLNQELGGYKMGDRGAYLLKIDFEMDVKFNR